MAKSTYQKTRYPEPTNGRTQVGRCLFVNDLDGNPKNELCWNKANGVYYYRKDRTKTFGVDYRNALIDFDHFINGEDIYQTKVNKTIYRTAKNGRKERLLVHLPRDYESISNIPESKLIDLFRDFITKNTPAQLSLKLKWPALANVNILKPLSPSITLDDLCKLYINRVIKPLHPTYRNDIIRIWKEFVNIIRCKTVREITEKEIEKYEETIHKIYSKKSTTNIKNRFDATKSVIRAGLKSKKVDVDNKNDLQNILNICSTFVYPDKPMIEGNPISVNDYQTILEKLPDVKWKFLWVLSLNAGLTCVDITRLKKSCIRVENKMLKAVREKKKVWRVAYLWDRTIELYQQYLEEMPHDLEYLFVNTEGNKYCSGTYLSKIFHNRILSKVKGTSCKIDHKQLKESVQSIPLYYNGIALEHIKIVLGHTTGISGHYLQRVPEQVINVCNAVEDYYFDGGKKLKQQQKTN